MDNQKLICISKLKGMVDLLTHIGFITNGFCIIIANCITGTGWSTFRTRLRFVYLHVRLQLYYEIECFVCVYVYVCLYVCLCVCVCVWYVCLQWPGCESIITLTSHVCIAQRVYVCITLCVCTCVLGCVSVCVCVRCDADINFRVSEVTALYLSLLDWFHYPLSYCPFKELYGIPYNIMPILPLSHSQPPQ